MSNAQTSGNTSTYVRNVYYQLSTKNKSFLDVHRFLKDVGIENNKFFLILLDPELAGVDPRDPRLNTYMKQKVARECMCNFWYFVREVVQIPDSGGAVGGGVPYRLHRGNLAMNFCLVNNYNIFLEMPRQHGKTMGVVTRVLWEFLFGTTNSEMMFIHKNHEGSKDNLQRLKDIRDALPSYLQMKEGVGLDGKAIKTKNNVESLEHPINGNNIRTLPAAKNKVAANSLGRGCTQPRQWYDEYAFIQHNTIIYLSATPAYKRASENAKRNGAPYGIIISTTPGDMTTEMGSDAFDMKEVATKFSEKWYDMTPQHLDELRSKNNDSNFVYIRFTYQQLGSGEEYFTSMVKEMQKKWGAIRREVLLEWSSISDNSPFKKEDLNIVKSLIKEPLHTITVGRFYELNIYEKADITRNPPLIGVDVAGGFKKDSSCITIIDSSTTKVIGDFNCNYISTPDLANVIYEIVTKYMRNAVVNIERNGGFGSSVLSKLVTTSIKPNLFYEIKDKVIEERHNGVNSYKKSQKTKVYGLDSNKAVRDILMEILRERMENHKDKFISPILYKELETLEVKKNGRVEHSSTGHDDQVFSYLLALYIWYEGKDLMERWHIKKGSIKTDVDLEEAYEAIESKYENLMEEIELVGDEDHEKVLQDLESITDKRMTYEEWMLSEKTKDEESLKRLLNTRLGRKTYLETFASGHDDIENMPYSIPDEIFNTFND